MVGVESNFFKLQNLSRGIYTFVNLYLLECVFHYRTYTVNGDYIGQVQHKDVDGFQV